MIAPQEKANKRRNQKTSFRGVFVWGGLILLICAGVLAIALSGKLEDAQRPAKIAQGKKTIPAVKRPPSNVSVDEKDNPQEPKREVWLGHEIVKTTIVTNGTDLIITRVDTEGKTHKQYTSTKRRLFTNPVDIVLSILLTTPEGAPVPPLPPLGPRADDIFGAALQAPIEISDEDSDEDKRIKKLVIAAREEMLQELATGRTVNDVIEDHCTYVDANNTLRAEAIVQYKELLAEGDEEMAEEYRKKVNQLLEGKGAATIRSAEETLKLRNSHFIK